MEYELAMNLAGDFAKANHADKGIRLLGGGIDEAPNAYKDSRQVIAPSRIWWMFGLSFIRLLFVWMVAGNIRW